MTTAGPPSDSQREVLAAALGAQYELLALIGRGAMGAVYLARERFLDRLVAVKTLPAELAASADARERFLREARTAAQLTHPHIVPLLSFGEAGETRFYVMGYVDGESLEARLRTTPRLSSGEATRIICEIADALHYAHAQGVVHRDIKPDNILLERAGGRALLADFGIAKRGDEGAALTGTGMVLGTPQYMSPEQAAGERDVDGRTDLYALGVIGYRMLTGHLPFEGSNVMEVLAQHMTREAPPIVELGVSALLANVVRRALAKEPSARWPTGHAMRAALLSHDDDADELLPDDVRDSAGMGVRAMLLSAAIGEGALASAIFGNSLLAKIFLSGALLTPALILGLQLPRVVRRLGWHDAIVMAFRQPRWWHEWWPRAARRAGNVWDRLPEPVRRIRLISGVSSLSVLATLNAVLWIITRDEPGMPALAVVALALASLAAIGTAFWRARRWANEIGLSRRDLHRVLSEPTVGSAFWRRPEIAALLITRDPGDMPLAMTSAPADDLRAIEAMALGDGTLHREQLAEGVAAAREVGSAITACDAELAELARDVAPQERARIEGKLAEHGAPLHGESEAKQRMRVLLGDQLALLRGLEARRSEILSRRERLVGHLHALRLGLATMRADLALDVAQASEITARIRAIRRDIEILSEARAEVEWIAPAAGTHGPLGR